MSEKELLTIDELARISGTTTRTIRFYGQEKLLPPPAGFKGRTALYAKEHIEKLKLIKKLKEDYFFPLAFIRKVADHPEKLAKMENHLRMSEDVWALLGYQKLSYGKSDMAKKASLTPAAIDRLAASGFVRPDNTEAGDRFSPDDMRIAQIVGEFTAGGFDIDELAFIPEELHRLAQRFFRLGHDKLHDAMHAGEKQAKVDRAFVVKLTSGVQELIGLTFRQLLREAFNRHHEEPRDRRNKGKEGE